MPLSLSLGLTENFVRTTSDQVRRVRPPWNFRKENQELKAMVAAFQSGKPFQPAANTTSPLMQSLTALTGVAPAANVVATDFGLLCKGDVVQVIHLPSLQSLVDNRGVVKVVGNAMIKTLKFCWIWFMVLLTWRLRSRSTAAAWQVARLVTHNFFVYALDCRFQDLVIIDNSSSNAWTETMYLLFVLFWSLRLPLSL